MRHHLSLVQQISSHHCFVACLSSFFIDNGLNVSQQDIVDKSPKLFSAGTSKEGVFNANINTVKQLETLFSLKITEHPQIKISSIKHPEQSVFYITFWENDKNQKHCVRLNTIENNKIILMNPEIADKYQEINLNTFSSWTKLPLLIELL